MPPFIPKKRLASTPPPSPRPTPVKKAKLAEAQNAGFSNVPDIERKATFSSGSDDSDSSLSDINSDQFEDVPVVGQIPGKSHAEANDEEDDDNEEFEDVELHDATTVKGQDQYTAASSAKGPIQLKFDKGDDYIDYGTASKSMMGKKGPSRREKEVRIRTHQLHVQFLLWHNAIRNRWICDNTVQQTLIAQLPAQIKTEIEKWRRASGLPEQESSSPPIPKKSRKNRKGKQIDPREERDWGRPSQRLDPGKADMSRGDPLILLLKVLAAYWKKRFAVISPGLRKRGYGAKLQLRKEVESYRNDKHDPEKHGERIRDIKEFREIAKNCEGSRDVGAQLFTALLRGLGIESRLVASLQPAGYGWTKAEQMVPRKPTSNIVKEASSDLSGGEVGFPGAKSKAKKRKSASSIAKKRQPTRKAKGHKDSPIDLESVSEAENDSDDESVVDMTPSLPKRRAPKHDRDLPFPIYWTEAVSPITNQIIPVDSVVLEKPVASTPEILSTFEPRGARAENARLVIAYVIGYSSDGTAKDVTVRYLRKHIWPGKTKPFRYPIEKVPIYDRTGRIKRYEDYDWFKRILSGYVRTDAMRTAVDDIEDTTDLIPQQPEKKDVDTSVDTVQSLKTSPDFVLERFLRREEALLPGAKSVRTFISGKGDNLKSEPVYRRADVERCLTAESWHKEGRHPRAGETPLKMVPVRAVTLTRKREAEEHERLTGEKQLQGLYSWDQTEYIIPPPIENGVIPKNGYGNIDCFVPSMVPKGAVHIPLRGTVRICKRLEIDYAEAVVGFEFGHKRAVPVIDGVVVAKENEAKVKKTWKEWNEEQQRKEAMKQEKLVLDLWRKFVMGLRIRERVGELYGEDLEVGEGSGSPVHLKKGVTREEPIDIDESENALGHQATLSVSAGAAPRDYGTMGGGFLLSDEEDRSEAEELVIEHHYQPERPPKTIASRKGKDKNLDAPGTAAQYPTPVSMSAVQNPTPKADAKATSRLHTETEEVDSDSELSEVSVTEDAVTNNVDEDDALTAENMRGDESEDLSSLQSDSELDLSLISSDDDDNDDDEDEDDYLPIPSSRRRPVRQPTESSKTRTSARVGPGSPRSSRTRRSSAVSPATVSNSASKSSVKVIVEASTPATPTRSTRLSQATGLRSPYFSPQSKGKRQRGARG